MQQPNPSKKLMTHLGIQFNKKSKMQQPNPSNKLMTHLGIQFNKNLKCSNQTRVKS
jgi:hypothetical protein